MPDPMIEMFVRFTHLDKEFDYLPGMTPAIMAQLLWLPHSSTESSWWDVLGKRAARVDDLWNRRRSPLYAEVHHSSTKGLARANAELREASASDEPKLVALAAVRLGRLLMLEGRVEEARAALDTAVRALEHDVADRTGSGHD